MKRQSDWFKITGAIVFLFLNWLGVGSAFCDNPPTDDPQLTHQIALGKYEIQFAEREGRPLWPLSALSNLPRIWIAQLSPNSPNYLAEYQRLQSLTAYSDAYYDELRRRYGLVQADFPNDGLPLGFTKTSAAKRVGMADWEEGFTVNCQICHSTSLFDRTRTGHRIEVGVSNVFLDFDRMETDLQAASNSVADGIFKRNPSRNSFVNSADYFARLLLFFRDTFPAIDLIKFASVFLDPKDNANKRLLREDAPYIPYLKTQPWITYKTKVTGTGKAGLYVDGGFSKEGNPGDVTYSMTMTEKADGSDYMAAASRFRMYGLPYLRSLTAPSYPFLDGIDIQRADQGAIVFQKHCSSCHGTYAEGSDGLYHVTYFPGRILPKAIVGTDSLRASYPMPYIQADISHELGGADQIIKTYGYTAPPLTAIWARAPYLHNASVPTVYQLLKSWTRYTRFAIAPKPQDPENFDTVHLGWKTRDLSQLSDAALEQLKHDEPYLRIYDPKAHIGLTNLGHKFGDSLSERERMAVIEFLKQL